MLPNGVRYIGSYAFGGTNTSNSNTGLLSVMMENNVQRIGNGAFGYCSKLVGL
jgi:hypothetical protein